MGNPPTEGSRRALIDGSLLLMLWTATNTGHVDQGEPSVAVSYALIVNVTKSQPLTKSNGKPLTVRLRFSR